MYHSPWSSGLSNECTSTYCCCRLIAEYLEAAPTSAVEDAVQTLSGVNLLRMAHTRDGATAACAVLAYGTAKDRKQAVKAMQGARACAVG